LTIKKSERDFAEGTNGGQGRIGKPVRVGEFQQALPNLVALLEHKRECLQSIFIVKWFRSQFRRFEDFPSQAAAVSVFLRS